MFRSFDRLQGVTPQQWRLGACVGAVAVGGLALSMAQVLALAAFVACAALRGERCRGRALWALPGVAAVLALSLLGAGLAPWLCAVGAVAVLMWASWPIVTSLAGADQRLPWAAHWLFALAALVSPPRFRSRSALRSVIGVSLAAGSAGVFAGFVGGGTDLKSATDALTGNLASIGVAVRNVLYGLAALTVVVCGGAAFMGRFPAKWLWTVGGGVLAMAGGGLAVDLLIADSAADSDLLYDHELQ